MGLYNFKQRFAPFILDGRKQHTIRKDRLDGHVDTPGLDICHCFVGLRTKKSILLGRWPCHKVDRIIVLNMDPNSPLVPRNTVIRVNDEKLTEDECERLARADGFKDFTEFVSFWRAEHKFPFSGHIIHWKFEKGKNERS